ncbi:vWA domain-containing protein [Lysinibacillus contaminans]|uniref:vWA domain-containing protein n=1 Tax=Lysinibacillus contaminans TaxID=1293441 RepID=UPI000AC288B2|nr:VWA domain-containing protein [Lysinibacillus contaminans]
MKRSIKILFFIIVCLSLLSACSEKTEESNSGEVNNTGKKGKVEEIVDEKIPEAARSIELIIEQKAGKLVEKHIEPELEVIGVIDFFQYRNFVQDTFYPIAHKELEIYFDKNRNLTSEQIYDYLVYQLGSGQYKSYYEQLISYEHGYVMPKLPDGEDEIEVVKKQKKTNVVLLMDASGSMKASVNGGVKMELAKESIKKFTEQLQTDTNVALLAYGHKGSGKEADKDLSCKEIETLYPLSSYESNSFTNAINSFWANGWTPLAGAIEKANELLADYKKEEYKNIVYIVSDGIETCGGDPVAAAKKLNESDIEAMVNIIGFDVDDKGQNQLKQVAEAGGGSYSTVRNQSEFEDVIIKKWKPDIFQVFSMQGVTLREIVDHKERLIHIHGKLYHASEREAQRMTNAVYFLQDGEFFSREVESEVVERIKKMQIMRNDHFTQIKDEKDAEARQAEEEIDSAVQAWKEKWSKELEKE